MFDRVAHAAHLVAKKLLRKAPVVDKTTKVRSRLVYDTEKRTIAIEVSVRSNARSKPWGELWGHAKIDANETQDQILYFAAKKAEAICNYQNAAYGDQHNPPVVANAMQDAVRDIFRQAERAKTRQGPVESSDDKGFK